MILNSENNIALNCVNKNFKRIAVITESVDEFKIIVAEQKEKNCYYLLINNKTMLYGNTFHKILYGEKKENIKIEIIKTVHLRLL